MFDEIELISALPCLNCGERKVRVFQTHDLAELMERYHYPGAVDLEEARKLEFIDISEHCNSCSTTYEGHLFFDRNYKDDERLFSHFVLKPERFRKREIRSKYYEISFGKDEMRIEYKLLPCLETYLERNRRMLKYIQEVMKLLKDMENSNLRLPFKASWSDLWDVFYTPQIKDVLENPVLEVEEGKHGLAKVSLKIEPLREAYHRIRSFVIAVAYMLENSYPEEVRALLEKTKLLSRYREERKWMRWFRELNRCWLGIIGGPNMYLYHVLKRAEILR